MSENKKYYFLKLKEDFFDQREIVVLEGSKDGILYVNILLKLYLKSLQHNGKLLLNEQTLLSAEMIALLTRYEVGTVERAMRAFMQPGLVVVLENDIYYMPEIEQMTGKGSSDAERKARYRRQNAEENTPLLENKNIAEQFHGGIQNTGIGIIRQLMATEEKGSLESSPKPEREGLYMQLDW